MNNKTLLLIFIALLLLFVGSRFFRGDKTESFSSQLVSIDTSAINRIILNPRSTAGSEITLTKSGGAWIASNGTISAKSPAQSVRPLLEAMVDISADRIVSKSREDWPTYEVDETGSRVRAYNGEKLLADFVVGAFKFDQAARTASSYVRLSTEDKVFLVNGFLSMQFNRNFDAFRNKSILSLQAEDLTGVRLVNKGAESAFTRDIDMQWYFAGMESVDSTQFARYVGGLSNVTGNEFAGLTNPGGAPSLSVEFTGNNFLQPVSVRCYETGDTSKPFIINSSTNPESFFLSDSTGVYSTIFGKLKEIQESL